MGQQIRVAYAAGVQQLGVDAAAGRVNRLRDGAPGPYLLDGVQSRRVRIALAAHAGLDTFGDDQSRRGALRVVSRHQRSGQSGPGRSAPGHRGHDDAVRQPQVPDLDRVERRDVLLQRKIPWRWHPCHRAAADAAGWSEPASWRIICHRLGVCSVVETMTVSPAVDESAASATR